MILEQQLQGCEINNDKSMKKIPKNKIELLKCQKKNNQRNNLIEESNNIKSTQTDKDCSDVVTYKEKLLEFKQQSHKINIEKIAPKIYMNKQNEELETIYQNSTQLLEIKKQLNNVQKKLNSKNFDLELLIKVSKEQTVISILISEKKELNSFTDMFKDCLSEKIKIAFESKPNETKVKLYNTQHSLIKKNTLHNVLSEVFLLINTFTSNKVILMDEFKLKDYLAQNEKKLQPVEIQNNQNYNKQNIEYKNITLMVELYQIKCQIDDLCQKLSGNISGIKTNVYEVQYKLNQIQSGIEKYIELKNNFMADVYKVVNDLETFVSTFIGKTYSQLAQVENSDEYSIIGKLKKTFEMLQMFIINKNTQGNEHGSNNAYIELFVKSNKYVFKVLK